MVLPWMNIHLPISKLKNKITSFLPKILIEERKQSLQKTLTHVYFSVFFFFFFFFFFFVLHQAKIFQPQFYNKFKELKKKKTETI